MPKFGVCLFIYTVDGVHVLLVTLRLSHGLVWRHSVDVNPNSGSVKSRQPIGLIKVCKFRKKEKKLSPKPKVFSFFVDPRQSKHPGNLALVKVSDTFLIIVHLRI